MGKASFLFVCIASILLLLFGVIIVAVGTYVLLESDKYFYLFGDEDTLAVVPRTTIACGLVFCIVGVLTACCTTFCDNKLTACAAKIDAALGLVGAIIELVVIIMSFQFAAKIYGSLEPNIQTAISVEYGYADYTTESVDALQTDFDCCGGADIADWKNSNWSKQIENMNLIAPTSCCIDPKDVQCNVGQTGEGNSNMNIVGCVDSFNDWLVANYVILTRVCLCLFCLEIPAMICVCCAMCMNKGNGYEVV